MRERRGAARGKAKDPVPQLLMKKWTAANKDVYYGKVRLGSETYTCGDCVAMETDIGDALAEILYIFRDQRCGKAWVENRWLYDGQEVRERVSKNSCPPLDDVEVFETDDVVTNPVETIRYKVSVVDEVDYRAMEREGGVTGRQFFCRRYFDSRLRRFMPIGGQGPALRLRRGRSFSNRSDGPDAAEWSSGDESSEESDADDEQEYNALDGGEHGQHGHDDPLKHRRGLKRRRSSGVTGGGATGARGEAKGGAPQSEDRFRVAMESLHVSAVPKSLPCRTEQRDILLHFLRSNVKSGGLGNAMFVSGMPGTGKTATAREVMGILRDEQAKGKLPDFKVVEVNGMRLVDPHQAYTQLWLMLGGEILTPKRALLRLERYFSVADLSRDFVVLLVDELDYMTTKKQTVLYNLFEWPSRPHARLVVVGIANTIDLPERCMPRVSSRLTSRLVFPSYRKGQLIEIVKERLSEANSGERKAFKPDAINMAAAKVAAATGDMRTCLKYCCRAIEVCKARVEAARAEGNCDEGQEGQYEVSVDDVHRAVKEINEQAHLLAVRNAAPQEKLMLVAICNEVHLSGREMVEMDVVLDRMRAITVSHPDGPRMPNVATILEMLSRMGDGQVLLLDLSRRNPLPDVALNMGVREVVQMLRNDTAFARKVLPQALTDEYPPCDD